MVIEPTEFYFCSVLMIPTLTSWVACSFYKTNVGCAALVRPTVFRDFALVALVVRRATTWGRPYGFCLGSVSGSDVLHLGRPTVLRNCALIVLIVGRATTWGRPYGFCLGSVRGVPIKSYRSDTI